MHVRQIQYIFAFTEGFRKAAEVQIVVMWALECAFYEICAIIVYA